MEMNLDNNIGAFPMFKINIFDLIFKNPNKTKPQNKGLDEYKFASLLDYINKKYPNCPNSDFVHLLKEQENNEL